MILTIITLTAANNIVAAAEDTAINFKVSEKSLVLSTNRLIRIAPNNPATVNILEQNPDIF